MVEDLEFLLGYGSNVVRSFCNESLECDCGFRLLYYVKSRVNK